MLSIKLRLAGVIFVITMTFCWFYLTKGVWGDYQDLLNHKSEVQLSLITLIFPIGFFGTLLVMLIQFPIAIFYGKKIENIFSDKTMKLSNKICIYSALLGVVSAVAFALYSMKLLDEYGYEYSYELTDITPTGIHLMYIKPPSP
uniref:Uncharacterized protein n=1 Tax=Aliivibrio fischeri TaxID=668 RepID=H2ERV4_ALIFS|nr:hypothetical protein [Aliivibrio fischeri]AEY78121.1 hypothetical protein [Aliivibrio fischeri]